MDRLDISLRLATQQIALAAVALQHYDYTTAMDALQSARVWAKTARCHRDKIETRCAAAQQAIMPYLMGL